MASLDLTKPEFWDLGSVDKELRRVYDICGGCRRCLPLCPSFKVLFDRLDVEAVDGDVEKLPRGDAKEVVDLCYQCKLCYNHCPYTPPHRWEVDFPRLMLRARAAQARQHGVSFQDRALGNTDLVGKLGSLAAPLANWLNELTVHRAFVQAIAGIHRRRNLPKFHRQTFTAWFKRHARAKTAAPAGAAGAATARVPAAVGGVAPARETAPHASAAGVAPARVTAPHASGAGVAKARVPAPLKIALFATCTVDYNDPATGRAAVRVLERNGVDVSLPSQRCCGMPYLDGGAVDQAKALISENVRSLAAAVREGRLIVVPGPTCSYMLKQEYPWLDGGEDAKLVAANTRDLFEYLAGLHAEGRLDTRFTKRVGPVTYHVPCHLRAQNIGVKSADVLRLIPGCSVNVVEKCSAVDGTWGLKKEYFELSMKLAKPLFDAVTAAGAPVTATDCPLAALQIEQGTGRQAKHPVRVLAEAYGFEE
jgi:glycerol-3-phosphate dehydrogenase subunit C